MYIYIYIYAALYSNLYVDIVQWYDASPCGFQPSTSTASKAPKASGGLMAERLGGDGGAWANLFAVVTWVKCSAFELGPHIKNIQK